jgi:hypothetical protein
MLTLREIYQFVSDRNKNELKDYYDKSYDTLKEMNKRSNLLTLFILVLLALSFFPTFIKDSEISGFKVSIEIIKLLCPLLIPYFLLEWCLIARRRRELMKVMKYAGFKIFKTPIIKEELNPFIHSIHSRNTIPFSFMMEILNVNVGNRFNNHLNIWFIRLMMLGMGFYLVYLLFTSFMQPHLSLPIILCNCLGLFCTLQIGLFYHSERLNNIRVRKEDAKFVIDEEYLKFNLRQEFDVKAPF